MFRGMHKALVVLATVAVAAVRPAVAEPGFAIGYGDELGDTDVERIELRFSDTVGDVWEPLDWLRLQPLWEVSVGHMAADASPTDFDDTWTAGLRAGFMTPLAADGRLFLDAATGPVWLSDQVFVANGLIRDMGGELQFRSHVGIGWYLDRERRFAVAYRVQHTSNARLETPNPGLDMHVISLSAAF